MSKQAREILITGNDCSQEKVVVAQHPIMLKNVLRRVWKPTKKPDGFIFVTDVLNVNNSHKCCVNNEGGHFEKSFCITGNPLCRW